VRSDGAVGEERSLADLAIRQAGCRELGDLRSLSVSRSRASGVRGPIFSPVARSSWRVRSFQLAFGGHTLLDSEQRE
jgi:hypothetical protein